MTNIHLLSPEVISAIAAGEVIERPAVIIKELIENAIDAGATKIEIEVNDEKMRRLRVTDNGAGMSAEDLPIAIQRHTTSKISTVTDLSKILSLGFRGEALASMANVSHLTIASRQPGQEIGYQLVVAHGEIEPIQPVGLPVGTTILVTEIFDKLPARKKFLKSAAAEFKQITEYVVASALCYPELTFILIHNRKHVLNLIATTAKNRTAQLFGDSTFANFVPVKSAGKELTGYVGTPQLARRTNQKQYLFINHRPVSPLLISPWIKESFGSLIEPRSEPGWVLFLNLPPATLDINVHPRKETVRFLETSEVKELVISAVKNALNQTDLTYQYQSSPHTEWQVNDVVQSADRTASSATESVLKKLVEPWKVITDKPVILQLDFTYLVTTTKQGVIIIDQHAAHERILYNQFLAALENSTKSSTQPTQTHELPEPINLTLPFTDAQLLSEHLATLQNLGFEIDEFGQQTFKISGVPRLMADRNISQLLNEIIGDLSAGKPVKGVDSVAQRTVAYLACRTAIQAGEVLTEAQRQLLFEKLAATTDSFTCPHGRPTTITFAIRDLEKLFKRR